MNSQLTTIVCTLVVFQMIFTTVLCAQIDRRIINGYTAPNRPFYVAVGDGIGHCAGTIVAPDLIVTAAHCVWNYAPDSYWKTGEINVYYGDFTLGGKGPSLDGVSGQLHKVVSNNITMHDGYVSSGETEHDIAVIKLNISNKIAGGLAKTVQQSYVLKLCDEKDDYSKHTIAVCGMGWLRPSDELMTQNDMLSTYEDSWDYGNANNLPKYKVENDDGSVSPQYLMEVQMKEDQSHGDQGHCQLSKPPYNKTGTTDTRLCLLGKPNKAYCHGDSGGPIFPLDDQGQPICLYGSVDNGPPKCNLGRVGPSGGWDTPMRVPYYKKWIESFMD